MTWPSASDYVEAVQNPPQCFQDAELRQGQTAAGKLGLPLVYAGKFAAVFQVCCPAGQRKYAVKCFTMRSSRRQERYRHISAHLERAALRFTVPFNFMEQGIRVRGEWYPIVKMDWVDGQPLNDFLRDHLEQPRHVDSLCVMWVKLAHQLREKQITHGDLQHGNVLLVPAEKENHLSLKLVDYDGLYVPAVASIPSGELGHSNYQHPERVDKKPYGAEVDRFSHLVIYTALRGLALHGPSLWKQFDQGENLLFRAADFTSPPTSRLLQELWRQGPEELRTLAGHVVLALQQPLERVPLLDEVLAGNTVRPLPQDKVEELERLLNGHKPGPERLAGFSPGAASALLSAGRKSWAFPTASANSAAAAVPKMWPAPQARSRHLSGVLRHRLESDCYRRRACLWLSRPRPCLDPPE